jgi:hypothetical protein
MSLPFEKFTFWCCAMSLGSPTVVRGWGRRANFVRLGRPYNRLDRGFASLPFDRFAVSVLFVNQVLPKSLSRSSKTAKSKDGKV